MTQSAPLLKIKEFVEGFIQQWPDVFFVDATISPSNKVTLLLDADKGMNIEKCAVVNRALYKFIEEQNLFSENNFSIEVSSPGIDKPLVLPRQFTKNIGRNVEVELSEGEKLSGKLLAADEEKITIEKQEKQKKNKIEKTEISIAFAEIKQVKVLVTF